MNTLISVRDLSRGFARAMNLIDPEVQNHHEKVAHIAHELAAELGMDRMECQMAMLGGLMHDIGSVTASGNLSLAELESNAETIAVAGAALLKEFPSARPFAEIIRYSQTSWDELKHMDNLPPGLQMTGQVIHMADVVSLLLNSEQSVLNQVASVRTCIHAMNETEFSPEVVRAFEQLSERESIWMDILYRPQIFLDHIPGKDYLTLDETLRLTAFMSRIIDFRSPFTAMHSAGVAASAVALAELSGMSQSECRQMEIAGYLHDVGKLKIPKEILEKPGKLTAEEFNVMKEHTYYTYIILKDVQGFEQITEWAAFHHEKLNGKGYPFHLKEEEISLGARIMTVADIFSALAEDRPYRKGMERDKAIGILREDAECGLVSQAIVELLVSHYDEINDIRNTKARAASKTYQESLQEA